MPTMSPVGSLNAPVRSGAILNMLALVLFLAGAWAVASSFPVAVPDRVRVEAVEQARERADAPQVLSVDGHWRPGGLAVDVRVRGTGGVAVLHFAYDGRELRFVDQTVGSGRGAAPFVGVVALAASALWIAVQVVRPVFSPKCPRHRWVALRVERRRLYAGGNNDEGLPLAPIDLVTYRCPRGDYIRRRVVAGPVRMTGLNPGDLLSWFLWMNRDARRRSFRGRMSDPEWQELFRSLRQQHEGEEWPPA